MGNQHDIIDAFQGGQGPGAEFVVEAGPAGSLVDVLRIGHGDDQDVAEGLGLLEVDDVAGMDQVKGAVALDDPQPLAAKGFQKTGGLFVGQDLARDIGCRAGTGWFLHGHVWGVGFV